MYQTVQKVVGRVIARHAVNEVINMKVNNLTESRDLVQHLTSTLTKNPSFTVPVTHLMRQYAQVIVAEEAKL